MRAAGQTNRVLELCDEALKLESSERESFLNQACADDDRLRASVQSVLVAISDAGNFLDVEQADTLEATKVIGQRIGTFRIIEKIDEGGMGAVYLAERDNDEFQQRVAIKLVRGHLLAKELVDRFNAEKKILAALNHPYIASLIDGGTTKDGMPYLVMEYVEGIPIDEYCDQHKLSVKERINLIQKVATAVHAAHQNLIVHRDLKPSNILVTEDGIPKLLDFGIAKLVSNEPMGGDGNTTIFGRQALTPNYASPEQILENQVTTASDVYSLGVLCYQLLCGELPYHVDANNHRQLMEVFETLEIPFLRQRIEKIPDTSLQDKIAKNRGTSLTRLYSALSGDLQKVLSKALHREPSRRYTSVAALSTDLDRYLAGFPVEAQADSVTYRLSRFIGRHKFGVGAAAAGVVLLVAGLGATSWAYYRAETARAEAAQRFDQVRALANTMMFDVYDEVSKLPGATKARQLLASSAQTYLDSLTQSSHAPPDVRLDAGKGYQRLAEVLGGVDDLTLGNRKTGLENYEIARTMLTDLHRDYPNNDEYTVGLAELYTALAAHALYSENDIPKAREMAQASVNLYDDLSGESEQNRLGKIAAMAELADSYDWDGQPAKTIEILKQTLPLLETVNTEPSVNAKAAATRARILRKMGDAQYYTEEIDQSLLNLRASRDVLYEVLKYTDNRQVIERSLAITLFNLAGVEVDHGQEEQSLVTIDDAVSLASKLKAANPNDAGTENLYSTLTQQRATILSRLGKHDEALIQAMESYNAELAALASNEVDPNAQRQLTIDIYNVGLVYFDAERKSEACEWLSRATDRLEAQKAEGTITGFDEKTLLPEIIGYRDPACSP